MLHKNTYFGETAKRAYDNQKKKLSKEMADLNKNIKAFDSEWKKSQKTSWGFSGTLGRVNQDLFYLNQFLKGAK